MTEKEAVRWLVEQMTERWDKRGLPEVPSHPCDYMIRPDLGTCEFHVKFVEAMEIAGYFEQADDDEASP